MTQKPEPIESIQFPEEVIVFTLESNDNECPGMLPEEKVSHFIWKKKHEDYLFICRFYKKMKEQNY